MWFLIPIGIVVYLLIGCFVAAIACRVTNRPWKTDDPDCSPIPIILAWPLMCMIGMIFGMFMGLEKVGKFIAINIIGVSAEDTPHNAPDPSPHPHVTASQSEPEQDVLMPEVAHMKEEIADTSPQDRFKLIDMEEL